MAWMRLDRFLAEMGEGSRSQMRDAVKNGRIQVDGAVERRPDRKIDPDKETVTVDGRAIAYSCFEYYMLNKPMGVVSATEDNIHKTVVDLIEESRRSGLFPVGRLDIDTEGLLLITNDGSLAHGLLSPKRHVDKRYYAVLEGKLPPDAKERFAAGITLEDGTATLPAVLEDWTEGASTDLEVLLTIHEGKFHQVKRMFEAVGCQVTYLKRLSMGSLSLDESLRPGQYRALTRDEVERIKADAEGRAAGERVWDRGGMA